MGPVSSTGRAMMASLNKAVQQGMPVDQAVAYVKNMAKDGVAPLVDLYAMLNQYQRLQQQQVRPPQTPPTIRDQMNMMEASQQGIAGLDSGVMENAQFAGGGIVAFQEGGETDEFNPRQFLSPLMGILSRPSEEVIDERMREREKTLSRYGLGPDSEAMKARRQQVEQMEAEVPTIQTREQGLDRAQFFFDLAAAASEPGSTLLSSLAQAGGGYTKASRATNERIRGLQAEAREAGIKMLEAQELRKLGDLEGAEKFLREGRAQAIDAGMKIYELDQEAKRARVTADAMREQVRVKGVDAVRADLAEQMSAIGDPNNPEYKRLLAVYNNLTPGIASATIRSAGKANPADLQALRDAGKELQAFVFFSDDDPKKIAATEKYNAIYGRLARSGVDVEAELAAAPQSEAGTTVLKYNPETGRIE